MLNYKIRNSSKNFEINYDFQKYYKERKLAINDLCEFLGIKEEEVEENAKKWVENVSEVFRKYGPEDFYKAWVGEIGIWNICANVLDQFNRVELFHILNSFLSTHDIQTIADYGCGTGVLSFSFRDLVDKIVFTDVNNLAKDFLNYRLRKYPGVGKWEEVHEFNKKVKNRHFDLVVCIDVLEHLKNSTEVFIKYIDPLIYEGGYLLLNAPWGGHVEHLDEAISDFYRYKGGRAILRRKYRKIISIYPRDVSGIYQKVRS